MLICAKCNGPVPNDEFTDMIEDLVARELLSEVVVFCYECQRKVIETVKFQLTEVKGRVN